MTTKPLPIAGDPDPSELWSAEPGRALEPGVGRGLRIVETLAGLLSAGCLLLGVILLGSQLFAPHMVAGATGPGWWAVITHLLVGAAGEAWHRLRRRGGPGVRLLGALLTVGAVVTVLALFWWR